MILAVALLPDSLITVNIDVPIARPLIVIMLSFMLTLATEGSEELTSVIVSTVEPSVVVILLQKHLLQHYH
jgi:hypothetical protein